MQNRKGFTLIELLIVVVIIGILAALAIPRFTQASARAKEKEADGILKQIFTLQNAYLANYGTYATSATALQTVGWDPNTTLGLKNYSAPTITNTFPITMTATGTGYNDRCINTSGTIANGGGC